MQLTLCCPPGFSPKGAIETKDGTGVPQSKERGIHAASPSTAGQILEYRRRSGSLTLKRHECLVNYPQVEGDIGG
jgi:hypothetical protein